MYNCGVEATFSKCLLKKMHVLSTVSSDALKYNPVKLLVSADTKTTTYSGILYVLHETSQFSVIVLETNSFVSHNMNEY